MGCSNTNSPLQLTSSDSGVLLLAVSTLVYMTPAPGTSPVSHDMVSHSRRIGEAALFL